LKSIIISWRLHQKPNTKKKILFYKKEFFSIVVFCIGKIGLVKIGIEKLIEKINWKNLRRKNWL